MFWNRKKYTDEEFGELQFNSNYWSPNYYRNGDKFYIYIEGVKSGPDLTSLEQAKTIMKSIDKYEELACAYIESKDIQGEICTTSPLLLESISSSSEKGEFDLCFGVEDDDWAVTIHFKLYRAYEVSLVH